MPAKEKKLTTQDHSRDSADMTYIYPVLSRRAGGLSVGINLNPNNACNWRCIYCQVPNLVRGGAPRIDLVLLEKELDCFLTDVLEGDFFDRYGVDKVHRQIKDIAISGNGEPTSAKEFEQVIEAIARVMRVHQLTDDIKLVLITNGSLVHRKRVQKALAAFSQLNGEIWLKLDSATDSGIRRINGASYDAARAQRNIEIAASHCVTWIQTCVFALDGEPMSKFEQSAYLRFIADLVTRDIPIKGILLYSLARPSMQAEASRLMSLTPNWLNQFAGRIESCGMAVKVTT